MELIMAADGFFLIPNDTMIHVVYDVSQSLPQFFHRIEYNSSLLRKNGLSWVIK